MKKTNVKSVLSFILCIVLIAATAWVCAGCNNKTTPPATGTDVATTTDSAVQTELGQGATTIYLDVTDKAGTTTRFTVHTDKPTVGEALQTVGLIDGEEGPYGLYVKSVNGITADYDADQTYWAFYINGEMAPTGADSTDIVAGTVYGFKVEK